MNAIAVTPHTKRQRAPMPEMSAWMIHGSQAPFDIISASMARVRRFYGISVPVPAAVRLPFGASAHPGSTAAISVDHVRLSVAEPGTTERFCLPLRFAGCHGAPLCADGKRKEAPCSTRVS